MTNIYWPVYKNLEAEMVKLFYSIHIDDNQLDVYSSQISDLILRASIEIESVSKELYKANGGTKVKNIKYDEDAIKHLNSIWKLECKKVVISSPQCFQTIRELQPFVKNEFRSTNGRLTYTWNNSYQNLKHDRANSQKFGSLKYLFDVMAALFILNLYYKDEAFKLNRQTGITGFPINMGSDIFSIKLHQWVYSGNGAYVKKTDFDECIYLTKYTDEFFELFTKSSAEMHRKQLELAIKHPKFLEFMAQNSSLNNNGRNIMYEALGDEEYWKIIQASSRDHLRILEKSQTEAVLNKDQV